MVDRSAHWLVTVLLTGLLAVFCTSAAWAGVIEGSVEETDGARVKVRFAAAEMPEAGDFVDLGLEDSDGRTTLLGTWKVTEVADGFVWAEALDEAAEPAPQAKAFIYAGSADICAEKKAGVASAIGPERPSGGYAKTGASGEAEIGREVVAAFRAAHNRVNPHGLQGKTGLEEPGWLGVTLKMVTLDLARSFGMSGPQGVLVASIFAGGPAEKAGFHQDDVIVNFDGTPISNCHVMPDLLACASPGRKVTVVLWRGGKFISKEVVMGAQPWAMGGEEKKAVAKTARKAKP